MKIAHKNEKENIDNDELWELVFLIRTLDIFMNIYYLSIEFQTAAYCCYVCLM